MITNTCIHTRDTIHKYIMKLKKNAWRFISQLQSYQPRYNNTNFNFIYIYKQWYRSQQKQANAWIKRRKEQQILTKQVNHHRITKRSEEKRHATSQSEWLEGRNWQHRFCMWIWDLKTQGFVELPFEGSGSDLRRERDSGAAAQFK